MANLNKDYNDKLNLDFEEQQRLDEAEILRSQRNKERLRQQEEDRVKRIQERIFGKNHAATSKEVVSCLSNKFIVYCCLGNIQ